ncbi:MAG: hypothetical protein HOQ22_09895, partial [Nocardioidaceae bacterium]|nr:hypothetical protein [Nocardioidaceae bacterium]
MGTDDGLDELVAEFVLESREHLDRFEQDVVALELDPGSADLAASAFRALHTLKGTSGYFGFTRIGSLSHHAESVLGALRDGRPVCPDRTASALFTACDLLRTLLDGIEQGGDEPDVETGPAEAGLRACLEPQPATAPRQRFGETL